MNINIETAKQAALDVLRHNARGPYENLPRTAGWGYPEPYTRDLMLASLGILAIGDPGLIEVLRRVLETLAKNQSPSGHIPGLVHDPDDRGSSDTTPLFLIGLGLFQRASGEQDFLSQAAQRAIEWLRYQSPDDSGLIAQQPTSDWRDEQWVPGYGLYVNALSYAAFRLFGQHERAEAIRILINRPVLQTGYRPSGVHEGLSIPGQPGYALWSYKVHYDVRFDLPGNCLAVLTGIMSPARSQRLAHWIEAKCIILQETGQLGISLPPVLWPYIFPEDADWRARYGQYNQPGEYHNGGVWPFACGLYVAALVAAGRQRLAMQKLDALTALVHPAQRSDLQFGFNEWFRAQDGTPRGADWQTWSAAMYLYAAKAVEQRQTPFFDVIRRF